MEKEVSTGTIVGATAIGAAAIAGLVIGIVAICKKTKDTKEAKYIHLK